MTPPPELGSSIAHAIKSGSQVVLKAVGAGAINQAVKAIPVASRSSPRSGRSYWRRSPSSAERPRKARSLASRSASWAPEIPAINPRT
ncbi:stage V sporulation protein S [Streptomyces sp. MBT84]|uniref:stage V sporulation protein S n=1 Tax=Streptomyces sp. MBT84 TaxID=1488414 RepID=UPI001C6F4BB0